MIFNHFDIDDDRSVSFDEFVAILISDRYEDRQAIVDKAFTKLDTEKSGKIAVSKVKEAF
jgi:Ca2+-binding EF-hand superfamily protein